ncbi:XAC0095 family protein [Pseudoxanthomonas composti]|uniref:XAC0095-like domain-containing protein n=1 Tax=Pseudoxanthomonas composti TaxID=2137479 RepID=A0A4Q1JYR1_9GAMM|nr:hypothetical protein [Pseudoxanthomonas composti]RXR06564.1 hypothetical protein EPA99_07960 [Pseudoxanthomonas composti]
MSEHAFDDKDMTGDFLPEDSQRLLTQIKQRIQALAELARLRFIDGTLASDPDQHMRELLSCLGPLAQQLELVLEALSHPARREAAGVERDNARTNPQANDEQAHAAEAELEASEPAGAGWALSREDGFTCGVTVEQIDQLNRLAERIKAYGDAVSASGTADFARGTLSILGHTIFDRAVELDALVTEIYTQSLEQDERPHSVRETPPVYCLQPMPWADREGDSTGRLRHRPVQSHTHADARLLH